MGSHSETSNGTRCPLCGVLYPPGEPHHCTPDTLPHPTKWEDSGKLKTEAPDPLVGTIVGERYRILKRLSAGGMGVVYQARHTLLRSLLAVKILKSAKDEDARARFLREAQIASQIQHPNTVFISDFGVLSDGCPYLVMEFLSGPTLRHLLERGALDSLRACLIGAQIARGLQTVHEKGIVHREALLIDSDCLRNSGKPLQCRRQAYDDSQRRHRPHIPLS